MILPSLDPDAFLVMLTGLCPDSRNTVANAVPTRPDAPVIATVCFSFFITSLPYLIRFSDADSRWF